jgi:beta-phosphoglucomutase-like phosphatase (HAD superfamily)
VSDRRFVLGVDLDGVVADFHRGLKPIAAEWLGVEEEALTDEVSYGFPEWGLEPMGGYEPLHRFAVTQRRLFETLAPIPGAAPALRRLSHERVRIRILTHRLFVNYFHREAAEQTIAWLELNGVPYSDLCFLEDKTSAGAHVYVEDAPLNVERLRALGQEVVVWTNSTNRHLGGLRAETWEEVVRLVLERQRAHSRGPSG